MSNETHTITIPLSRWIEEKLGALDNVPIHKDDAGVVELLKPPHVIIQWEAFVGESKLKKPLMWNIKAYRKHEAYILERRKESELRVSLSNKYRHNIEEVTKFFMEKHKLSYKVSQEMATKIVLENNNDTEFLQKYLKIDIQEVTSEERKATGEYYKRI